MKENKVYVGMDVHKNNIVLAGYVNEEQVLRFKKTIVHDKQAVKKEFEKVSALGKIVCCYEAGFSGYDLCRFINSLGHECYVIAPSLIPQKTGDKVKTDEKDAKKLASLLRAGLLTRVNMPDLDKEKERSLLRLRGQIKKDSTRAKHRILKFLALRGISYKGNNWSLDHRSYLNALKLESIDQLALSEYLTNLSYLESRLKDIDEEVRKLANTPKYKTKVDALCCFRGISTLSAMVLLTEIKSAKDFSAQELMSYFGLTPSEHSSGENIYRGAITKQGNSRLRHIIVEAAWHYLRAPKVGAKQAKSFEGQDKDIVLMSIRALKRLNKRFLRLALRKNKNIAVVAVARELVGFIWAALMRLEAQETI